MCGLFVFWFNIEPMGWTGGLFYIVNEMLVGNIGAY